MCGSLLNTDLLAAASEALEDGATSVTIGLGLAVVVAAAYVLVRRAGGNPFRGASVRGSLITPSMALLPAIGFLLASALLGAAYRRWGEADAAEAGRLAVNSLAQVAGAACCLWVAGQCFRGGVRRFLFPRRGTARQIGAAVLYLLAAGALCELAAHATKWLFLLFDPAYQPTEHAVIDALRDPATSAWAVSVLWIGALGVAPFAEECFFRGVLQTFLLRTVRNRWVAVLIPAVLFGLAHGNQAHVVPALTLFGIILGIQYERSGALVGPIALHAMFNLKTLLWQWLVVGG